MLRRTLNLGILAHVDAGKTTLTERLLYAAGVTDAVGSVDRGTARTDSLALEQQRGITIRSAVVSFELGGVTVNLIDTPGHPDFIAEVERVLAVLDGSVVVLSAVEGVQPQTRILMRALQRLGIPTLLFVNKLDRTGADVERVLGEIRDRLTPAAVALTCAQQQGGREVSVAACDEGDPDFRARHVEVLAENDEALLRRYVEDEAALSTERLREQLAAQTAAALVHPVYCGSALTGAGFEPLTAGIAGLLPARTGDAEADAAGLVFKIERSDTGERIAYVRLFSGEVRVRDRVRVGTEGEAKVTALRVFAGGADEQRDAVHAGEIAKFWGLREARIGDRVGEGQGRAMAHEFQPPTLESVIDPLEPAERERLRVALGQLAEQDPLIDVRQDDERGEISVSLYGEVQKEVIEATLASDYGVGVRFRETTPIYVERPRGSGEAGERLNAETNPVNAELFLRVEPGAEGSGVELRLALDTRTIPLYLYKTPESFEAHMDEYVRRSLGEGIYGWRVVDCVVTLTGCAYPLADGPPSRRGPMSTSTDFRVLTAHVLRRALERAGTVVCEPTVRVLVETPTRAVGAVVGVLARLGAAAGAPALTGELAAIETVLSATRARELQRQLSGLTHGEGVLETAFDGYRPVVGDPPRR